MTFSTADEKAGAGSGVPVRKNAPGALGKRQKKKIKKNDLGYGQTEFHDAIRGVIYRRGRQAPSNRKNLKAEKERKRWQRKSKE
jgi:hypothetical protein